MTIREYPSQCREASIVSSAEMDRELGTLYKPMNLQLIAHHYGVSCVLAYAFPPVVVESWQAERSRRQHSQN